MSNFISQIYYRLQLQYINHKLGKANNEIQFAKDMEKIHEYSHVDSTKVYSAIKINDRLIPIKKSLEARLI